MTTSWLGRLGRLLFSAAAAALLVAGAVLLTPRPALAGEDDSLDPGLVGSWYWETSSYVSSGDFSTLIKTVHYLTIRADGRYLFKQVSTIDGDVEKEPEVRVLTGYAVQRGNVLIVKTDQGRVLRLPFQLDGDNGLYLNGVLYERQ